MHGDELPTNEHSSTPFAAIEEAAKVLQRPPAFRDKRGYQCELLAAAVHPQVDRIAYVESRMRKRWWSAMWDVSIKIHLWRAGGQDRSVDIRSYNPFFGCEVEYFQWLGEEVVLIYTEKHETYACGFGSKWPPRFVEIKERWSIDGLVLTYWDSRDQLIGRLSIPDLTALPPT